MIDEESGALLAEQLWACYRIVVDSASRMYAKYGPSVSDEAQCAFTEDFRREYKFVSDAFLMENEEGRDLDRHKVAAIGVVSLLRTMRFEKKAPPVPKLDDNNALFPRQRIALAAALHFMLEQLNHALREAGVVSPIGKYYMPHPLMCRTPYADVLARELYYMERYYEYVLEYYEGEKPQEYPEECLGAYGGSLSKLNPIVLAHELFLLEYITLLKGRIDPAILEKH